MGISCRGFLWSVLGSHHSSIIKGMMQICSNSVLDAGADQNLQACSSQPT